MQTLQQALLHLTSRSHTAARWTLPPTPQLEMQPQNDQVVTQPACWLGAGSLLAPSSRIARSPTCLALNISHGKLDDMRRRRQLKQISKPNYIWIHTATARQPPTSHNSTRTLKWYRERVETNKTSKQARKMKRCGNTSGVVHEIKGETRCWSLCNKKWHWAVCVCVCVFGFLCQCALVRECMCVFNGLICIYVRGFCGWKVWGK